MTAPASPAAEVAGKLSEAQRRTMANFASDEVRDINRIHHRTYAALYREGLLALCLAGGFYFACLTPLGLEVRGFLLKDQKQ